MAGTWTPGHRRRPPSKRVVRLEDAVIALGQIHDIRTILRAESPQELDVNDPLYDGRAPEQGEEVTLLVGNIYGSKATPIRLSQMTTEELDTLKQMFDLAYERARPVTSERDRVAAEAADNGDDSYIRRHRPAPTLVIRSRSS